MREKISLRQFKKYALPSLLAKHERNADKVNAAIKNNFDIIDESNTAIDFMVDVGEAQATDDVAIDGMIREQLQKTLKGSNRMNDNFTAAYGAPCFNGNGGQASGSSKSAVFKGPNGTKAAERWGAFALACVGNERMKTFLANEGIQVKANTHSENVNTAGGFLVPEELYNDIISLLVEYGVARRETYIKTMTSDSGTRPRRTGGLTATFVGEGQSGTKSAKTWDQVRLTAKKLMTLAVMSSELNEDSVISVGDDLASEIAYAFATKEDQCWINGDASLTYGGITGIVPALSALNGVDDGGGLVLAAATHNLWSELDSNDMARVVARCPSYARVNAKWYASLSFIDSVMSRLLITAGGAAAAEVEGGMSRRTFLGYPIVPTEVMPTTEANSQISCLFGNARQSTTFGDRREMTIRLFDSGTVDGVDLITTDQLGVRGTERFDIVNHDLGTATVAGPIVGLIMSAS